MNDLDTLRPEVAQALGFIERNQKYGDGSVCAGDIDVIRAELLRLARENDEWQMRCLQFQTERDHARQMHADRDVDVQHEWARAEAAEAELAEALKANRDCVDHFEQMQAELAALKARIDGSRHAFLGPNMDRITFLAEDIGPVGEYALVKAEE